VCAPQLVIKRERDSSDGRTRVDPGGGLITTVNRKLADDNAFRQQIRDLHARQAPLIEMVEALGLQGQMSDAVRKIVAGLGAAEVDGIRTATLEMLDRAGNQMPVDCNLSQTEIDGGAPVTVAVVDESGVETILVRAAT
jgi:hypothetical protein